MDDEARVKNLGKLPLSVENMGREKIVMADRQRERWLPLERCTLQTGLREDGRCRGFRVLMQFSSNPAVGDLWWLLLAQLHTKQKSEALGRRSCCWCRTSCVEANPFSTENINARLLFLVSPGRSPAVMNSSRKRFDYRSLPLNLCIVMHFLNMKCLKWGVVNF